MGMGLPVSGSTGMLAGLANPLLAGALGAGAVGGPVGEGGAATKAQRELYVGNLPPGITVPQLAEFLNAAFKQLGLCKDATQNTVITAWVSPESHYAFVELRTIEEATAALTYLNGIQVGMFSLKFGRPKGYTGGASSLAVPMVGLPGTTTASFNNPLLTPSLLGGAVGLGASNPLLAGLSGTIGMGGAEALSHTIMVSNLPALISEQQIRELFTPFGELKAFNIIRTTTGQTQSAVFEYTNPALTDGVVTGMNNLDIAGQKLSVQRIPQSSAAVLLQPNAAVPPAPAAAPPAPAGPAPTSAPTQPDELAEYPPSAVIRMSNMTTPQDLSDDQSYEELMEDVADECNSHGTVKSIVIPRSGSDASVGKIFVHFVDVSGAQASRKAVAGRKFNGRVVEAYFYPEELFLKKVYNLPEGYLTRGSATVTNGSSNGTHTAGSSASEGDINDIDEGERPSSKPVEAYDPTASMEDLD
jgi:splicing factor U2AF subunit